MNFLKIELIVVLIIVGVYLAGIILVYLKVRQPARSAFETLSTHEMTQVTNPVFQNYVNAIQLLGFDLVAHLRSENGQNNTRTILTLLYNHERHDQAIASEICVTNNGAIKPTLIIEFISEFTDGREICTNNSETLGVFAPVPEKPIYQLPEIKNAASLYFIHSGLAASLNAYKSPLPLEGNEIASLADGIERSLKRQTGAGYLYHDESSQTYRPTIKGAAIMTLKSLWPMSFIRKRKAQSHSLDIRNKYQVVA